MDSSSTHSAPEPVADTAFEARYLALAPALYAWARLRVRRALHAHVDPQDLVQEVWMRAFSSQARFDPAVCSFRAWLFGIARHVLLENFRRLARRPGEAPDGLTPSARHAAIQAHPDSITSVSGRLARDDALARFLVHLAELSPDERQLLEKCGLEGRTCGEAALRMGLSEDAVLKRWQRLRARLRHRPWARELLEDG